MWRPGVPNKCIDFMIRVGTSLDFMIRVGTSLLIVLV